MPIEAVWVPGDALRAETSRGCEAGSEDPACVGGSGTGWRVWFPPDRPEHVINSLRVLRGGTAYLIRAKEPTRLTVVGRPNPSKTRWTAGYNLAGFHVVDDPQRTPTIAEYLAGSPAHAGTRVYRVDATGTLTPVPDPTTERIQPGMAYWIRSTAAVTYDGPLDIDAASLRGIAFTHRLSEHAIRVQNKVDRASTVHIRQVGARNLSLAWFDTIGTDESSAMSWRDLSDDAWELSVRGTPSSSRTLRVAARRGAAVVTGEEQAGAATGMMELSDDSGFRRLITLEMEQGGSYGLWVGTVTVDAVSWVADPNDSSEAIPTSSQFVFRMIIHSSASGAVLLPDVVMGIDSADPENPLPILIGPTCSNRDDYLDSETNAPRVSTTAFSIDGSQSMSGVFATSLTATLELPEDQRLSPFRHQFNPTHECNFECVESTDHDGEPCTDNSECGDGRCKAVGGGCRKVIRLLDLSFDDQDSRFSSRIVAE